MLLDKNGYSFKMNLKRGEKIYWGCSGKVVNNCPARAVTNGINVTMWSHAHNHEKSQNSKNYYRKIWRKKEDGRGLELASNVL